MDRWKEEREDEGERSEEKALSVTSAVAPAQCSSSPGRHSAVGGEEKLARPVEKVLWCPAGNEQP